ncbi:hypothetical protein P154DRAFT_573069 [Amniculicola lignicola CBS 123094]|uniref:Helicase ATP-binding domain-containing protein n=1 Tax=Amniculicola lignicola CBS 123094 TaxID=1392246 RepID=A0A6A5WTF1_9PLEO|nr:hypothetical protein P154DRAFT_573069 [Amniculicola lignicola CBS 123094]
MLQDGDEAKASDKRSIKTLTAYDIVVTTYETLEGQFKRMKITAASLKPGLKSFRLGFSLLVIFWRRGFLDEAHRIRSYKTHASEATCLLHAQKRLAMTGTLLHSDYHNLQSIMKFLRIKP